MIDYLARQNSDALVVGWALSMMLLAFAAIAFAGIAMWTGNVLAVVLSVALLVVFWVPTVLLILVSKKQETWSKGARLWGEADD